MLKRSRLVFAIALTALLPLNAPALAQSEPTTQTEQAPGTGTPVEDTTTAPGAAETAPQPLAQDGAAPAGTAEDGTAPANAVEDDDETALEDLDGFATEDEAAALQDNGLPHDLSPWGMFMAADIVVKGVMLGLAVASIVTWAVLVAKLVELGAAQRSVRRAMRHLIAAQGLKDGGEALSRTKGVATLMLKAAQQEMESSEKVLDHVSDGGVKERVASRLSRMEVYAGRQITKGTGLLATIGSTAPFVGLFGTVWGIMNSFIGISQAQTTNLAIVAPGIAEALLATAIGLVAAIPAVIIYNFLARAITGYRQNLADASAAIERLVSRDLDMRRTLRGPALRAATKNDPSIVRIG